MSGEGSRRLYVVPVLPGGEEGDACIAFIPELTSFGEVLTEIILSVENSDRTVSVDELTSCVLLAFPTMTRVMSTSALRDDGHYFLCYSLDDSISFLNLREEKKRSHGYEDVPIIISEPDREEDASIIALRQLGYAFDANGVIREIDSREPIANQKKDHSQAARLQEAMKITAWHIQSEMVKSFDQLPDPSSSPASSRNVSQPSGDSESLVSHVYLSKGWQTCEKMIVVFHHRNSEPGVWSRSLLISDGLGLGSMLSFFQDARKEGYAIAVLHGYKSRDKYIEHATVVWDKLLAPLKSCKSFYFFAFRGGAEIAAHLLVSKRTTSPSENDPASRISAMVFCEGGASASPAVAISSSIVRESYRDAESGEPDRSTEKQSDRESDLSTFYQRFVINFISHSDIPSGSRVEDEERRLGCLCVSVGDYSDNKAKTIVEGGYNMALEFYSIISAGRDTQDILQRAAAPATSTASAVLDPLSKLLRLLARGKKNQIPATASGRLLQGMGDDRNEDAGAERNSAQQRPQGPSVDDFEIIRVIGKGSIGKVSLVRRKADSLVYAMKVVKKSDVRATGQTEYIKTEKLILQKVDHPFIAKLKYSFQRRDRLYFITEYCSGGELFHHLSRESRTFDYFRARFYSAEIALAVDFLHSLNIVYRDLKPENILIDREGHIKLTDFGMAKMHVVFDSEAKTFVGSPEYLAPEVLLNGFSALQGGEELGYGKPVDWWGLGVVTYEMLLGLHPFYAENSTEMVSNILAARQLVEQSLASMDTVPQAARAFLLHLLERAPADRLGTRGGSEVKDHEFFAGIDWDALVRRRIPPPWRPEVYDDADTRYVDPEFLEQSTAESSVATTNQSASTVTSSFTGFTYDDSHRLSQL